MKEIPILYSAPMIRAKLDGRKTITRRIAKDIPDFDHLGKNILDWPLSGKPAFIDGQWECRVQTDVDDYYIHPINCKWSAGDILWSRETHIQTPGGKYHYKADIAEEKDANRKGYIDVGEQWARWKPSIHQPKGGARIWERVTQVRIERLQDISEDDAIKEGARYLNDLPIGPITPVTSTPNRWSMESPKDTDGCLFTARMAFANLINKINGERTWDLNPWVWVITTEILSTTGRPKDNEKHYEQS